MQPGTAVIERQPEARRIGEHPTVDAILSLDDDEGETFGSQRVGGGDQSHRHR
jgi:hypothetical protein